MSTIITRAGKGSALSHNEMDTNLKKAAQTKATVYTIAGSDNRDTIEYSGAGSEAFTLPDITTVVAAADTGDFEVTIKHVGTGELTIARTTGTDTIDGTASDIVLSPNDSVKLKSIQAGTGVNVVSGKYKSQVYTSPTLTSPDIDKVVDSNGNEVHIFAEVASAVNEITETNAATGNNPSLAPTGESNLDIDLVRTGGTGTIVATALETPVATTSGTSVVLSTTIPTWAKRIHLKLVGVSANGSSSFILQIGDSGGYEITGYASGSYSSTAPTFATSTIGFIVHANPTQTDLYSGEITLSLQELSTNTWVSSGIIASTTRLTSSAGSKSLSATLDRVQITTVGGADTFDAGSISVSYSG